MNAETAKREAARAALAYVPDEGVIGLGTGSTSRYFIEGVAELVRAGRKLEGVATSEQSRRLAAELGIPLLRDEGPFAIDLTVDGADEVSPSLDLIKGGGGCHTREKLVNLASKRNLIAVDKSKLVTKLGESFPVPVEVLRFGHRETAKLLAKLGACRLRMDGDKPFVTDSGGLIYDLTTGPIEAPRSLDNTLKSLPGVVETGLFLAVVERVIVAGDGEVYELGAAS